MHNHNILGQNRKSHGHTQHTEIRTKFFLKCVADTATYAHKKKRFSSFFSDLRLTPVQQSHLCLLLFLLLPPLKPKFVFHSSHSSFTAQIPVSRLTPHPPSTIISVNVQIPAFCSNSSLEVQELASRLMSKAHILAWRLIFQP